MAASYKYERSTGQYRGNDGRFVSPSIIATLVNTTQNALRDDLKQITSKLTSNRLSIAQWQAEMMSALKTTHYQLALLGSGNADVSKLVAKGLADNALQLDRMGNSIAQGKYSATQISNYAANYANSTKATFYEAQIEARGESGIKTAKRVLDGQAKHCQDCLRYAGLGYVSLEDLVLPTNDCECGQGCKCSVVYRWY